MKKISVSLLFCFVLSLPTFSQTPAVRASFDKPLAAKALSDGSNGVFVQWEVETEDRENLGFNIYRLEKDGLILVNPRLIHGVSLESSEKAGYFRDNTYSFIDAKGSLGSQYVIEAIDINGNREKTTVQTEYSEGAASFAGQQAFAFDELTDDPESAGIVKEFPNAPLVKRLSALNQDSIQNSDTQKWVASQPGAKFAVRAEGLYRVTREQLATTNFNVNSPVANWQLYADGIEQPIIVEPNGNFVEFYGRPVDNRYTDTKFYYLVAGDTAGRRMSLNSRRLNNSQIVSRRFANNSRVKYRTIYYGDVLNGEEENFWGFPIAGDPSPGGNVTVNLRGIEADSAAQTVVTIKLQAISIAVHSIAVKLNNNSIGTITGNGRVSMEKQFVVPTSMLIEGSNVFAFSANSGSTFAPDTITISYPRRFVADQNRLTFTTQNGVAARITGFTATNIRVFDISDPNGTSMVNARNEGAGNVFIPANRPQMLYAVSNDGILQLSAAAVTSNSPSTALTTAANKDLVIVSHGNFIDAVQSLATYRRSQGLTVEVVNVEDVFDETNFGYSSPLTVRSFLQAVNPKYVLLVGDGNYDHRNYQNIPPSNLVPTRNFETVFGEAVTDDLLTDFNNDNIPDIPVGRFPVKEAASVQNIFNKIQSFEANVSTALQQKGVLFVSDDPVGWDFYNSNLKLRNELPANTPVKYIKRSEGDAATVRQLIVNDINAGRFLVVYSGHGQIGAWWSAAVFGRAEAAVLTNTIYPLFLPVNCLNGAFADSFSESLSEVIVETPNGAVASWSSSALTFPDSQELMATRLFKAIGSNEFTRFGDAAKAAKAATNDADVRRSWILLGDPTLKIR